VVGGRGGPAGAKAFLMDQVRDRMDFPQRGRVRASRRSGPGGAESWSRTRQRPGHIAQVRKDLPGLVAYNPKDAQEARANAISAVSRRGTWKWSWPDPEAPVGERLHRGMLGVQRTPP